MFLLCSQWVDSNDQTYHNPKVNVSGILDFHKCTQVTSYTIGSECLHLRCCSDVYLPNEVNTDTSCPGRLSSITLSAFSFSIPHPLQIVWITNLLVLLLRLCYKINTMRENIFGACNFYFQWPVTVSGIQSNSICFLNVWKSKWIKEMINAPWLCEQKHRICAWNIKEATGRSSKCSCHQHKRSWLSISGNSHKFRGTISSFNFLRRM